jgi:hypothetical protein
MAMTIPILNCRGICLPLKKGKKAIMMLKRIKMIKKLTKYSASIAGLFKWIILGRPLLVQSERPYLTYNGRFSMMLVVYWVTIRVIQGNKK